jgi:O-antigen ligase/tetratricopeptide (TPR) repeat protein
MSRPEGVSRASGTSDERRRFPRAIWIGRARLTPLELCAFVGGLAVFGNLAWDSALWDGRLQLLLHVLGGAALVAGLVAVLRGARFPRSGLEVPILAFLFALGLASVLGQNHGLAARAMAATVGFAALLPLAILSIRRRPILVALVLIVPTLVLATTILWQLVARRVGWFSLGVGGLPPVRVVGESTAFGSVAVPPFILLGLLPLCLLVRPRWLRLLLMAATVSLIVPLAALSGSRSAWLALGVAGVVFVAPAVRRLRRFRPTRPARGVLLGAALVVVVLVVAVAFVAPRFTAITSLVYRERLWTDTLAAWSSSPLTGIGPGTMPYARQAVAAPGVGPIRQPHSHDLALGVLGDAGLLGLAAALSIIVVFIWIAGPHRSRTTRGRAASSVLAGFLVAGVVEDLTFLPAFDLIVLVLAAVSIADAGAVSWTRLRLPSWAPVAAAVAVVALLIPVAVGDAASVVYRLGTEDVYAGRWRSAEGWYRLSITLDPWQPSGPKALTVAADMVGDRGTAIAAARAATTLNPGDGPSWTNLAVLCTESSDRACAIAASDASARWSPVTHREQINAALVQEHFGNPDQADDHYRRSLLDNPATALSVSWPRRVLIDLSRAPPTPTPNSQLALALALAAEHQPVIAPAGADPIVQAVAAALVNDRARAAASLEEAERREPFEPLTWEIASMLKSHWGEDATQAIAVAAFLRGKPLSYVREGPPPVTYEISSLHIYPHDELVQGAERLMPAPPWPWALWSLLPPTE